MEMTMTGCDNFSLSPSNEEFAKSLARSLMDRHGPLIANEHLRMALGYPSMAAFRQALVRNTVPVQIFNLPKQRGKFAFVEDVAYWLALQRETASAQYLDKPEEGGR